MAGAHLLRRSRCSTMLANMFSGAGRSAGGHKGPRLPTLQPASKMQFILSGCKPAEGPENTDGKQNSQPAPKSDSLLDEGRRLWH